MLEGGESLGNLEMCKATLVDSDPCIADCLPLLLKINEAQPVCRDCIGCTRPLLRAR